MKHARVFPLLLALLCCTCMSLFGQTPSFPDVATLTPESLIGATIEPAYSLLVLLSGYLSAFIPGVKKWAPFYRVVAFALVTGLGFSLFGATSFWKLALTYFLTSGLYVTIFKNLLPSPKATTA